MAFPIIYFLPAITVAVGNFLHKKAKKIYIAHGYENTVIESKHKKSLPLKEKIVSLLGNKDELQSPDANRLKEFRRPDEKTINKDIGVTLTSMGFATAAIPFPLMTLPAEITLLYSSRYVFICAYRMLKSGKIGVDLLTSLAILGCLASGYIFIGGLVNLIFFISMKLLIKVSDDSRGKLTDVFSQIPKFVWMETDGVEVRIPFQGIKPEDLIIVNAGETIPVDGIIVKGMASIDQHMMTGEAAPAERSEGEKVFALTTVLSGRIVISVECAGKDTTVSKIGEILDNTVDFQSTTELRMISLADKTVPPTLIMSGVALLLTGPYGAVAVLNAHFKYRFMLVTPVSIMNFLKVASGNGILIKDGRSLDLLPKIDTIVFDKTGTLTEEQPRIGTILCCGEHNEDDLLRYTAIAESKQTHPIAMAIMQEAEERGLDIPIFQNSDYRAGYGIAVQIDGDTVHVGSHRFMQAEGISLPQDVVTKQELCHDKGHSLVMTAVNQKIIGVIELIPALRPEAEEVIRSLQNLQQIKEMYLISGDHDAPTRTLAKQLGIENYYAETSPEDKAKIIKKLREAGKFICYVGDGINDALAMKNSNLSVSLRGASTIATDTARIILMDQGLGQIPFLFDLALDFQKNSNLMFALIASPTAIGMGCVFLSGMGIMGTTLLGLSGLLAATGLVMTPLLKYSDKNEPRKNSN
jgi:Cu2+-exporting ATPase